MDQAQAEWEERRALAEARHGLIQQDPVDNSQAAWEARRAKDVAKSRAKTPGIEVRKLKGRSKISEVIIDRTRLLNAPPVEEEELTEEEKQLFDLDRHAREYLPKQEKISIKEFAASQQCPFWMFLKEAMKQIDKDISAGLNEIEISDQRGIPLDEVRDVFAMGQGEDVIDAGPQVPKETRKQAKIMYDNGASHIRIARDLRMRLFTAKWVLMKEGVDIRERF